MKLGKGESGHKNVCIYKVFTKIKRKYIYKNCAHTTKKKRKKKENIYKYKLYGKYEIRSISNYIFQR